MEKLIVFTNKRSIKNFMPEDRERNKVEFKEIKELENFNKIGGICYDTYTENGYYCHTFSYLIFADVL